MHRRAPLFATIAVALTACGDSTGPEAGATIRPQLIRLTADATPAASPARVAALTPHDDARAWSSGLEIESFETPIRAIWLENDTEGSESLVYECAADTNDGCLVDLAGPALQDLLGASAVTIREGTYTRVAVSTCESEGSYTSYVTGTVHLADADYHTKTATVLGSDGAAEPVALEFSGCQRAYPIPTPVVVSDTLGEDIDFRLYFDIRDIAWASLGATDTSEGWIPGGCAGPRPDGVTERAFLCVGYPDVAGVVDDQTPTVERYRINDGATVGLIFQASDGSFIGGYTRRYFEEGMAASPGFTADTPVESFEDNGDGSYTLLTYGGSDGAGGPVGHYLTMEEFVRDTHGGIAYDFAGNRFQYEAHRIQ